MKINELKLKLSNNYEIPQIGYGTYRVTNEEEGINAIKHALNFGYKLLDTADIYKNHHIVKEAIKQSNVKREDIFLTTKVWPTHNNKEEIKKNINRLLEELGTDYIDLLIVHWPLPYGNENYKVLEEMYEEGSIKSIGVSNYNVEQLTELLKICEIKPMVNQIELHPKAIRQDVIDLCNKENIKITSWQTIMEGKVGEIDYIKELADKYKVDGASIALKWALQKGLMIIPKSVTLSRIESNISNLEKFELTNDEIKLIDKNSTEDGMRIDSYKFNAAEYKK